MQGKQVGFDLANRETVSNCSLEKIEEDNLLWRVTRPLNSFQPVLVWFVRGLICILF
jgi:hypothetical protein